MNLSMTLLVIIFVILGRFELLRYQYKCDSCGLKQDPFDLRTILKSGYWPCSPKKFGCLIQTTVFEFWDQFRKQMPGSSERSFLESLNAFTKLHGRVSQSARDRL
jgi:hypothetical protein